MTCTNCRQEKDRLWHSVGWQCDECVNKIYQDTEYIKVREAAHKEEEARYRLHVQDPWYKGVQS